MLPSTSILESLHINTECCLKFDWSHWFGISDG
uniref:YegB n=1 Tax=Neisseria gonorrhoeae TaxID=485 RepID=Q5EP78_NEIGO|nr:YegB [Neisseria gonorrhoeae]